MKRLAVYLAAFGLSVATGQAEGHAEWLNSSYNFGAFNEDDGVRSCTLRYVNVGDEPLSITAARSSCGCTLAEYSRKPLAPGDTSEIVVTYDPTGRPGRFSKHVYINFDNNDGRMTLTVNGVVIGAPTTLSQRYPVLAGNALRLSRGAIMAGDVAKGRMKTVFVDVYNASTDSLRPSVSYAPPYADVSLLPDVIAPGEQASLVCHVNTARTEGWGLVEDSVVIIPARGMEAVTVPVTAVISEDFSRLTDEQRAKAPAIRTEPERLDFGEMNASGEPVTLCTHITNDGRNPLEIRRVYTTDPGIEIRLENQRVRKGKRSELCITVHPDQLRGKILNSKIVIISNDPTRPNLSVRAVGLLK